MQFIVPVNNSPMFHGDYAFDNDSINNNGKPCAVSARVCVLSLCLKFVRLDSIFRPALFSALASHLQV
jgi:hypothetical protein